MYAKALTSANQEDLRTILKKIPDVNMVNIKGKKKLALNHVIKARYERNAAVLLDNGANPKLGDTDKGASPLMWAFRYDFVKLAERLIEGGADVNAVDNKGRTVLYWACGRRMPLRVIKSLFQHGAVIERDDIVQWSIEQGNAYSTIAFLYEKSIEQGVPQKIDKPVKAVLDNDVAGINTYLAKRKRTLRKGSIERYIASVSAGLGRNEILKAFTDNGYDIVAPVEGAASCLQYACEYGQLETVMLLIQQGADINAEKTYKHPLILAIEGNHKHVVRYLLDQGVDAVDFNDSAGRDLVEYALCYSDIEMAEMLLPLNDRFSKKKEKYIDRRILDTTNPQEKIDFLINHGYSLEQKNSSGDYLFVYSVRNDVSKDFFVRLLNGASLQTKNITDRQMFLMLNIFSHNNAFEKLGYFTDKIDYTVDFTILRWCIQYGSYETFCLLFNRAKISQDEKNRLLVEYASACFDERFAAFLIGNGADVNAIDENGNTALMNGVDNGFYDVVKYLVDLGADKTIANKKGKTVVDIAKQRSFLLVQALL